MAAIQQKQNCFFTEMLLKNSYETSKRNFEKKTKKNLLEKLLLFLSC